MYTGVTTENDPFLVFTSDSGVSKIIEGKSCYGFGEIMIYEDTVNNGETFLDIGTNIGAISFQLKKQNPSLTIFGSDSARGIYDLRLKNISHRVTL